MSELKPVPMTVEDLIRTVEHFPKDAYVVLPGERCAEACYYTMELDKPEKDGGRYVKVVKII